MTDKQPDSNIEQLIQQLGSESTIERQEARHALVKMGDRVEAALIDLLDSPKHVYRWEAIETLAEIGGAPLIPLFISKLDDDESDIRWIASKALIKIGAPIITPVLKLVVDKPESLFVLVSAHHIFHALKKAKKLPENFPIDKLLSLLKVSGVPSSRTSFVYEILNKMEN